MSEPLVTQDNLDYALQILREVLDESMEEKGKEKDDEEKKPRRD